MEIYNATSLQELLNIKRKTIFEKIDSGVLPSIKKKLKTKTKLFIPSIFLDHFFIHANRFLQEDDLSTKDTLLLISKPEDIYKKLSPKVYTVANIKGGVGNTIISVNIAHSFSVLDRKVLLVDLDPQANSTDYLEARNRKNIKTLMDYYFEKKEFSKDIIKESLVTKEFENGTIDVLPSEIMFARSLEYARVMIDNPHRILYKLLKEIKNEYEFIIIDTPPSPGLAQQMALYATDKIIISSLPDEFSIDGLIDLIRETTYIKDEFDKDILEVSAIFVNKLKQTNIAKANIEMIRDIANKMNIENIFEIPESSRVTEAVNLKLPLLEYKPELEVNLKTSEHILEYVCSEIIKNCTVQENREG
jgi:chromosome partitioning protein